ncbi:MAG: large-conductance mechanosensitive channel protein MscL [Chitinophagales bacterium]
MMKEFKDFAMKGNLIDLAVGFVMGAAFTAVTTSFISGIVMPLVSLIAGKDFSTWKITLRGGETDAAGVVTKAPIEIMYGTFISAVIYFIIVAFVMFMVVKAINAMKRKEVAAPAAPPAPTKEELLLMEIRDLLKK